MILKGSHRAGGQNLATHLMKLDDNEHMRVHELRGFASDNLHGAFKEAEAISRATRCTQYLFSLSLNPPEGQSAVEAAFTDALDRIEKKLGLEGQPRAVVFHEKEGRRHAHCAWSRIDGNTLTARPLPFFKNRLMEISRELYSKTVGRCRAGSRTRRNAIRAISISPNARRPNGRAWTRAGSSKRSKIAGSNPIT